MAKKSEVWVTGTRLAELMGVKPQRIYNLHSAGVLKRRKDKKYHYPKCKRVMEEGRQRDNSQYHEIPPTNGKLNGTINITENPRKALDTYKAKMAQLEYEKRLGELVEIETVVTVCRNIITNAKRKFLAVPTRLAPQVVGHENIKKIKGIIEAEIHQVLEELADLENVNSKVIDE